MLFIRFNYEYAKKKQRKIENNCENVTCSISTLIIIIAIK